MNLVDVMTLETYVNKNIELPLLYRIYHPAVKRNSYRVFIFLHGAGERGTDGEKHIQFNAEIIKQIIEHPVYGQETIIIAPQIPMDTRWVPLEDITKGTYKYHTNQQTPIHFIFNDFLENELEKRYNVDPSQIYIGGLSNGGAGTIDYITRYPEKFAAAIAICGTLDLDQVAILKKTPLWLFHSSDDPISYYLPFNQGYQALKKLDAKVKYTEYSDVGHGSWIPAYQTPNLIDWLFSHKK